MNPNPNDPKASDGCLGGFDRVDLASKELNRLRHDIATVTAEREALREATKSGDYCRVNAQYWQELQAALDAANEHAIKLEKSVWESGKEIASLRASAEEAKSEAANYLQELAHKDIAIRELRADGEEADKLLARAMSYMPCSVELYETCHAHFAAKRAAIDAARLTSEGGA